MQSRKTLLSIVLAFVAAGCTSVPPGARAISASEIESSLTGRTWSWNDPDGGPRNGIYYAANNQAEIRWKGELYQTTWSTRNGAFCHKGEGNKDNCWSLYEKDGVMYARSQWQPEFPNPYPWNPATDTRAGRRI